MLFRYGSIALSRSYEPSFNNIRMELPPKKIIDQLRSVTLFDTERASLRTRLVAHMRETGVQRPVLSPWSWLMHAKRFQAVALSLVIIVSYGSSVTLAAEGSLPGDILYPIKTRVTEPVARLVIATSPAAEATFETRLLEKRLQEAEILDTRKELNPELEQTVRAVIHEQSIKAEEKIKNVRNTSAVKALRPKNSIIETSTTSSANILERSGARGNSSDDTQGGDNDRDLKGVREKHKRILEKLDLSDEEEDRNERD